MCCVLANWKKKGYTNTHSGNYKTRFKSCKLGEWRRCVSRRLSISSRELSWSNHGHSRVFAQSHRSLHEPPGDFLACAEVLAHFGRVWGDGSLSVTYFHISAHSTKRRGACLLGTNSLVWVEQGGTHYRFHAPDRRVPYVLNMEHGRV